MSELDKAKEAAYAKYLKDPARKAGDTWPFTAGFDAGLATATAKIEALEAELAAAERLRQTMRANLFAIYNGTWTSSGCPTLAAFADSCLEHVDNELQKENTDA